MIDISSAPTLPVELFVGFYILCGVLVGGAFLFLIIAVIVAWWQERNKP